MSTAPIFYERRDQYSYAGIDLAFQAPEEESLLSKVVDRLFIRSTLQTLVHEIGHALAWKYLKGKDIQIQIHTGLGTSFGKTIGKINERRGNETVITSLAGVMSNIGFSLIQLIFFHAIQGYLSIYFLPFLYIAPIYHLINEIRTEILSAYHRDEGDFGKIAKEGCYPLLYSTAAVVTEIAIGTLFLTL